MAGIALQIEGPIAPKEWVRVGDKEGVARGVSASPPVEALVSRFADSAVEYDLRFWTGDLARLGPGSFFGEMSLLTGEPRSASVVAVSEVEVVVVEKDAFSTLLHDDGHLARALSEALEERTRSQARVEAPAAGTTGPLAITDGLLDRIQRFFGLEG